MTEKLTFQTRDYRPEDAPALAALYREAILETGRAAYSEAQCAAWAAAADDQPAWASRLQDDWVRVAEDATGRLAGFGAIRLPGRIDLLFVAPHAGRQGVAALLLDDLLALAAAMGAREIDVEASELARPFFERHGFRLLASGSHVRGDQQLTGHHLAFTPGAQK